MFVSVSGVAMNFCSFDSLFQFGSVWKPYLQVLCPNACLGWCFLCPHLKWLKLSDQEVRSQVHATACEEAKFQEGYHRCWSILSIPLILMFFKIHNWEYFIATYIFSKYWDGSNWPTSRLEDGWYMVIGQNLQNHCVKTHQNASKYHIHCGGMNILKLFFGQQFVSHQQSIDIMPAWGLG